MESKEFDEGKALKDCLPGELFLFAIQGFIFTGELLIKQNPNSKAQLYDHLQSIATLFFCLNSPVYDCRLVTDAFPYSIVAQTEKKNPCDV